MSMVDEFATPPDVADKMVEYLFNNTLPDSDQRILIPGCGTGNLLDAIQRYCDTNETSIPHIVAIEIDRERLTQAKQECHLPNVEFFNRDFLADVSDLETFEYIIANPPYIPWEKIPSERQKSYEYQFTTIAKMNKHHAYDMYVLFFEQSLELLTDSGRLAFIVPNTFATPASTPNPLANLLSEYGVEEIDSVSVSDFETPIVPAIVVISDIDSFNQYKRQTLDWKTELANVTQTYPITVSDIMTEELVTYSPTDNVKRVFFNLVQEDFDVIPIIKIDNDSCARYDLSHHQSRRLLQNIGDHSCIGYIHRRNLARTDSGAVQDHMEEDIEAKFVNANASFETLLDQLTRQRFVFVGDGHQLEGLVTRSDLNRSPVYFHLYSKIAQLEIGLREICREQQVEITDHLDCRKVRSIKRKYRRSRQVVPDLYTCTTLGQLINLCEGVNLFDNIGIEQTIPSDVDIWDLNELRINIAHYYPLVHTMGEFPDEETQRTAYKLNLENQLLTEYNKRLSQWLS